MYRFKTILRSYRNAIKSASNPPIVAIELTNRCNAHCTMCWRDEVKRAHKDISFNNFKAIVVKSGQKGARIFQLSFFGESTLYKALPEAVAFIKGLYNNSTVVLNTNAAELDKALAIQLLEGGIDQIRISIDGNNADEYEKIRVGLKYSVVRENVLRLWRLIQKRGSRTQVLIQGLSLKGYLLNVQKYHADWAAFAHEVATREEHALIALKKEPFLHKILPCPKIFSQSIIMVNGDVCICAYDWHGRIVLGNAIKDPIKKIWNASILNHYRRVHLIGLKRTLSLCKDCTYQMFPY